MNMGAWETLGSIEPRYLSDARLQLHWAAQAASAPGRRLLPFRSDHGEQSFQWHSWARALAQGVVAEGSVAFRSALRLSPPALLLLGGGDQVLAELPLHGRTLAEAYAWLGGQLKRLLGRPPGKLERPAADLPEHPFGRGAPFSAADPAPFTELARWYGNLDAALRDLRICTTGASEVRCWPRHLEISTLVTLDLCGHPGQARFLRAGLCPGGADRSEPYVFVEPRPRPQDPELPSLPGGGRWHTEGWLGAVLDAERIVEVRSGQLQRQAVDAFLKAAVFACRRLLA
jgi:hypothetical protein